MRNILCLISLFLVSRMVSGQTTFQRSYGAGGYGYSVVESKSGGFIVAGYIFNSAAQQTDFYLMKTDSVGDTLWTKTIGGSLDDVARCVIEAGDGGVVAVGESKSFNSSVYSDFYIVKTAANGNLLWSKAYGKSNGDAEAYAVQQATDGGYIIGGSFLLNSGHNLLLVKTSPTGFLSWIKTFDLGGDESIQSIEMTPDSGFVVTGTSYQSGSTYFFLIKFDKNGTVIWHRKYNDALNGSLYCYSVHLTLDKGYIITGGIDNNAGQSHVVLIKTDSLGYINWAKTYGGTGYDYGWEAQQTFDTGYVVAGKTNSFGLGYDNAYVVKTDSSGNLKWSKIYGGNWNNYFYSIKQTTDSGFIQTGLFDNTVVSGLCLAKTDSLGNSHCPYENDVSTNVDTLSLQASFDTEVIVPGGGYQTIASPTIGNVSDSGFVCIYTGINEIECIRPFELYPNPMTTYCRIEMKNFIKNTELIVTDLLGKAIIKKTMTGVKMDLKVNLERGFYFVTLMNSEYKYTLKMAVE